MAINIAEFEQLIKQLMSDKGEVRVPAEKAYSTWKEERPDVLVIALLQIIRSPIDDTTRSMCVVLLRPLLVKDAWAKIPDAARKTVYNELLVALEQEKSVNVRHKVCSAIAELGSHTVTAGGWAELLPFMFKCTKSDDENHRESALVVFSDLAGYMGEQFRPYVHVLKDILTAGLTDARSFKVRVAALAATANFLQALQEPQERAMFQQLTPSMLETINAALHAQKEEEAQNALELFTELAEVEPTFFRPSISQVVDNMMAIASADNLEDSTRHMAIEVLLTLVESRAGMMRKVPNFLTRILHIVIKMMLTIEDQPLADWNADIAEEEEDTTDYEIAEEAMDRLAMALGGKTVVPELFQLIPNLLANADWRQRHCALMSISLVGEGCSKFLVSHLANIMNMVLPLFRDAHPRVRWAAANCTGQMASDFAPGFQKQFHAQLLPCYVLIMDDVENPRVQSHAAAALINFCENCESETLAPYLDGLLAKLAVLLQGGKIIVQEQAITAIASIADCAADKFEKYYDNFMPFLKSILVNANNKEYRKLRGKAMECISLIGGAVGKAKFFNDAKDVMNVMMQTQAGQLDADDPQISFMQQAWARICKCLGSDFVQFLPYVMPSLLTSASAKTDLTIVDADEDVSQKEGWDFVTLGDKQVGINTSTLEEKSTACHMLYCYASELKGGFFPYVDNVAKLIVPLLKFFYHDGVRQAAVSCAPALLVSASQAADKKYVKDLFDFILSSLLEGIQQEMDLDILSMMLESFVECLDVVGENALSQEQHITTKDCIKHLLADYAERQDEQAEKRKAPDVDDEEEEKLDEESQKDEDCLVQLAELIGRIAKFHPTTFFPCFEEILTTIFEFLQPNRKPVERQVALCVIDDTVEFTKQQALKFFPSFLQLAISYITDADPGVRQAAVYGIGIFAMVGGEHFAPLIPDVLVRLNAVVSSPDSRSEENINPTENAISAVGRICESQPTRVDLAQVLPVWLSYLPVTEDKIESKVIYNMLCSFVEKASAQILGQGYQHLPKLLHVFATILGTDLVDEPLTVRIVTILKQMQAQLPQDALQSSWASLTPDLQQRLQQASQ